MEKQRADDGFIPAKESGWHMERAPTPYQTRRIVRAVAAVIHRNITTSRQLNPLQVLRLVLRTLCSDPVGIFRSLVLHGLRFSERRSRSGWRLDHAVYVL
jgi:hypothetical protein